MIVRPFLAVALAASPGLGASARAAEQPAEATPQAQAATAAPADDPLAMDAITDIGIDWPDLEAKPATEPLPAEENAPPEPATSAESGLADVPSLPPGEGEEVVPEATDDRLVAIDPSMLLPYRTVLRGLGDAADEMAHARFDLLSALRQGENKPANLAQIRRRGRADTDLLDEILRARGYYDSRTRFDLGVGDGQTPRIDAILEARPGGRYPVATLTLFGLPVESPDAAKLRALFDFNQGDPADTDLINAATDRLREGLAENGYPFANVRDPVLTVDHEHRTAALNLSLETGGFRRFGRFIVSPGAPFDARHVGVISRLEPGEPYRQSDIEDLNRALVATGLVSQVKIEPRQGAAAEDVDVAISMTRAPPRTIAGELGYGTGQGARLELSWQHRNLFPPEGALTVRGVAGTQEQSLGFLFRRNNFGHRDRVLNVELSAANIDQPAYQALTAGLSASLERQTNLIFQKTWTWSLGTELRISDERDLYGAALTPRRRTYLIFALPSALNYDGSDDLLDPRKGFRLGTRLSPELSLQDGVFSYLRAQVDGSAYVSIGERWTLAGRVRVGTIIGASADRIAPTRRYYAGGGGSVRGYSYQAIGPRDLNNDPVGGRSLGEISIEARFRFGSMNQFGIVPFIDAGTIDSDPWPSLSEMRVGAGIGVRYYSNFGPIRVDVGTPLNPQPGDSRIGVYVSLGQAF